MRTGKVRSLASGATVGVHLIIALALVAMSVPSFGNIAAQLQSGYIPPDYWGYPTLVLLANLLAALVLVGTIRWWRGVRRNLVVIDLLVLLATSSVLIIFVFSNNWPVVTVLLSPLALLMAWQAPGPTKRVM
jgi:hypothetical protein